MRTNNLLIQSAGTLKLVRQHVFARGSPPVQVRVPLLNISVYAIRQERSTYFGTWKYQVQFEE